ncbi:MAG: hypothetical protein JO004_04180, partial [Methylobacteriaceae bacterium]|nr:hypothetical protein [Methylobacteriaceae bacterium]
DHLSGGEEESVARGRGRTRSAGRGERGAARGETPAGERRATTEPRSRPGGGRGGEHRQRDARPERSADQRSHERQPRQNGRPAASERGEHHRPARHEAHEPTPVGLGDHVPSFLLRPTRLPQARRVEEEV